MSINLRLGIFGGPRSERTRCELWQTPTHITLQAMDSGANAKNVYFAWLDHWLADIQPEVNSKLSKIALRERMKAKDYQDYLTMKKIVLNHKNFVETYLKENPNAEWRGL